MIQYEHLLVNIDKGISVITLNRPEKLNCLTIKLWKDIAHALKEGDENPDVQVQIITGSGRAFCAGDDISLLMNPEAIKELLLECIYGLYSTFIYLQKPLIAAVNGPAYGGGCEMVLLSDLAVASDKATFAQPEARIGAWPMVFAMFGPALLGQKVSNEFTLLCEPVSAEKALSFGLVNRVVPQEKLMQSAFEMAYNVMKSSPVSLKTIKETSAMMLGERLYDLWIAELRALKESSRTKDWQEGSRAFVEKRPPQYQGR